jgi:catechol 2,3-dioxygenase-like lactoylglutathione lyase family enzyme
MVQATGIPAVQGSEDVNENPLCPRLTTVTIVTDFTSITVRLEEHTMPIKVLELHHHGIRIGTSDAAVEQARQFYGEVLGLEADSGRPTIPGIPGFWLYVGSDQHTAQIHLMGAEGMSPMARSAKEDPTIPHVALAVEDIQEARRELDQRGIWYWQIQGLVGQYSDQIFVRDPFGNVIELHQIGTCRCNKAAL